MMAGESVPLNYLPILLFIGIAIAFGAVSLLLGWFVRPSRPYRAKLTPYESGSPLFSDARIQFPMRYYIIAMLFVIFDIEIIFMIPSGFSPSALWASSKCSFFSASFWSDSGMHGRRGR
jgi:NADH-quinone oxidoreductase subunit A